MITYLATPRKLRNGDWGIAIQEELKPKSVVEAIVTTRTGKTWSGEYVIIWSCPEFSLGIQTEVSKLKCGCGEYWIDQQVRDWFYENKNITDTNKMCCRMCLEDFHGVYLV